MNSTPGWRTRRSPPRRLPAKPSGADRNCSSAPAAAPAMRCAARGSRHHRARPHPSRRAHDHRRRHAAADAGQPRPLYHRRTGHQARQHHAAVPHLHRRPARRARRLSPQPEVSRWPAPKPRPTIPIRRPGRRARCTNFCASGKRRRAGASSPPSTTPSSAISMWRRRCCFFCWPASLRC